MDQRTSQHHERMTEHFQSVADDGEIAEVAMRQKLDGTANRSDKFGHQGYDMHRGLGF